MPQFNELTAKLGLSTDETIDLRNLFYNFWEYKLLILTITFTVIALACIYTLLKVPIYEGNTLIQIESKKNDSLGPLSGFSLGPSQVNNTAVQIALMRSRFILEPVIDQLGLIPPPKHHYFAFMDYFSTSPNKSKIIAGLIKKLHIVELGEGMDKTGILQITYRDTDTVRLVKVLNTIVKVIQAKDEERKLLETAKILDFLHSQLTLVKDSLQKAESTFNQYRATSGKLDIQLATTNLLKKLDVLEKKLTDLKLRKSDYLQRFTPKHPFIISLNDKIKQLEKQKNDLEKQIKTLPASDQIAINLMRDVKVKNHLYLILLNKIQELKVVKAGTLSDIRILSVAIPPEMPLPKHIEIIFIASLALGLILGIIATLVCKAFKRQINDPQWVEQHFGIPNLAIIPYSKQQKKNIYDFKNKTQDHLEILAQTYTRDLSIEALRSLRTQLQIDSTKANNIITVTGVCQAIGKSFITVNFSYLLAHIGKRVLLIDGDIRKGHLHDYFKLERAPGLSELITNDISIEQALHKTSLPTLQFLSCGSYPSNPAEMLMGEHFRNIIKNVSQKFDFVVIDTAPILAVTDSTIICTMADTNLLVIGSDRHQPEEITIAIKRLKSAGIHIYGSIFNILNPQSSVYGYYRYNYSAYDHETVRERL